MLLFHVSFELIESLQHSVNKSDTHSKKEAVFFTNTFENLFSHICDCTKFSYVMLHQFIEIPVKLNVHKT